MMARWNASIVVILVGLVGLGDASIASAQGRTLVRIVPGTGLSALEASFLHSETERRLARRSEVEVAPLGVTDPQLAGIAHTHHQAWLDLVWAAVVTDLPGGERRVVLRCVVRARIPAGPSDSPEATATMVVPAGDPIPVARIAELLDMLMGMALHGRR